MYKLVLVQDRLVQACTSLSMSLELAQLLLTSDPLPVAELSPKQLLEHVLALVNAFREVLREECRTMYQAKRVRGGRRGGAGLV